MSSASRRRNGPIRWWILPLIAVIWLVVVLSSARNKSATIDEVPHIGAGLSYLHFGDFRMNPEHPPLMKILSVLPAYLFYRPDMRVEFDGNEVAPWFDGDQNFYGYYLLFYGGKDPLTLLLICRIIPALTGLLGAWLAFLIARRLLHSDVAGLFAALTLTLYPEYAGHARFVTLDVPTLVACAAISWCSLRWWQRTNRPRTFAFIATAAFASQIKLPCIVFTAFMLVTMTFVAGTSMLLGGGKYARRRLSRTLLIGLSIAAAIIAACWASTGFRFSYLLEGAKEPLTHPYIPPVQGAEGLLSRAINLAWEYRLLPETTLATLTHISSFNLREVFLFQQKSYSGWYHYFLVTIGTKTSIFYLLALILAAVTLAFKLRRIPTTRRAIELQRWSLFLIPFALLFVMFCYSRTNIGHRHILFVYFPFAVIIATGILHWWKAGRLPRMLAAGFVSSLIVTFASTYPHYATYFNEAIRTPYRGSKILADSNIDWGQDMPLAADYLHELGETSCNLATFGASRRGTFGIHEFNWLLPSYPFAIEMPEARPPDPNLYSLISLHVLPACRAFYPEFYNREPDLLLNSIVVFDPLVSKR